MKHAHTDPLPEPKGFNGYFLPASDADAEITVKRSRFLARVRGVTNHSRARETVDWVRTHDAGASHVAFAYAVGPPAMVENGMSDDGEPHGTAGRPILSAIEGRNLTNAIVTVTRWFGGTKLGTGGLVRAYTRAAVAALEPAGTRGFKIAARVRGDFSYAEFDRLAPVFEQYGVRVSEAAYGVTVSAKLALDSPMVDDFLAAVQETINRFPDLEVTVDTSPEA